MSNYTWNPVYNMVMEIKQKYQNQFNSIDYHTYTYTDENNIKKEIDKKQSSNVPYFYEREVWWCSLGLNVGWEQDGKNGLYSRPVVIIKIFTRELLWGIPLTTKERQGKHYHQYKYQNKVYTAILSQLRGLSTRRLIRKVGKVPETDFNKMKKRLINLFK